MMLDEEARSNAQMTAPPQAPVRAAPPPEGVDPEMAAEREAAPQAGRQASPAEEKMFSMLAKQALQLLTSESGAKHLLSAAKSQGPEQALASAAMSAIDGVMQAAEAGGVRISPQVKGAAALVVVTALAGLMAEGGLVDDPQALTTAVMSSMKGGPRDGNPG